MSIEKKKPTNEFYSALDEVITHQIKSRKAFDKAIEIGRKQGYDDFAIGLFIKEYLKEKLPKTTLWRYLKEINPDEKKVPMKQINYNNVLEQKDIEDYTVPYEGDILNKLEDVQNTEKYILDTAKLFEKLGYTEEKIFTETKRMCRSSGMGEAELEYVDQVLHWKYDTFRKLDEAFKKGGMMAVKTYLKIAVILDICGIPRDKISARIKETVIPIQGMEESYFVDYSLQNTPFADPKIKQMDYLGVWIKSILPRESGGYVDDEQFKAEKEEKEIGIGDGRRYKPDEKYCRHCIMKPVKEITK